MIDDEITPDTLSVALTSPLFINYVRRVCAVMEIDDADADHIEPPIAAAPAHCAASGGLAFM